MVGVALLALALSALPILGLCIGDPKRRRTAGRQAGMPSGQRRLLLLAACIPGIACLLMGDAAAFMLWLGGSALIGWILAACFPDQGAKRPG